MITRERYLKVGLMLIVMAAILLWIAVDLADAGTEAPYRIKATGNVTGVYCAGPCCCGSVSVVYRGHWYSNGAYCRWFVGLTEGQRVTTRLTLWR